MKTNLAARLPPGVQEEIRRLFREGREPLAGAPGFFTRTVHYSDLAAKFGLPLAEIEQVVKKNGKYREA